MPCYSNSPIPPDARVLETSYLFEDGTIGLSVVYTWAQLCEQSNVHVFRDLDDVLNLDTPTAPEPYAVDKRATTTDVYLQHPTHSEASIHFNPRKDVLWLCTDTVDEADWILDSLRQSYGKVIDLLENVVIEEWCWREVSAPRMAEVLDGFGAIRSVTLLLFWDQDASDWAQVKVMALEDVPGIAPRPWRIQYVNRQGPMLCWRLDELSKL